MLLTLWADKGNESTKTNDGLSRGYARILYYDQFDAQCALVNTIRGILGATINVTLARLSETD
eukprot:gnl/Chilomastix_caulleri/4376.p2 GENE.gnl/Chilomastix_caulleri/4376~~gnl/Chilomastix_caulleri/4376.p2  ORF type:complete len:63 (+),score=6.92 gnl/Chilomastix_caulleri/4376:104-292(+)